MSDIEETNVTYGELADLEFEFDQVETEIIRQQYALSKPLYAKRAELVAKIPKFWPLVMEQAPMDIDEYIQPSDSALLLSSLTSLSVSRFEVDADEKNGDPRSLAIRFEFAENEHFEDKVLEKKFWWRYAKDGYAALVSEPVEIKWKEGKDLTEGLLGLAKAVYDEQKAAPKAEGKEKKELTEKQKALKKKIDETGMGGVSFFAWFGYIGEYITAEESKATQAQEAEERRKRKAGEEVKEKEDEEMDDNEDEDDEEEDDELEIFPTGDAVAMAIADDLWPGALKYFTQAQEQDVLSELDFETDDEEDEEEGSPNGRPHKKQKGRCAHGCEH